MATKDELVKEVAAIFKASWDTRDGTVVPADNSLKLGNDAVQLDATVLYADLADSTKLVDSHKANFAAEIYKTFLHCAAKIIRQEDGAITAYDGDRIMAVFIGNVKNTSAVRAAMKINYAVIQIIDPAMQSQYPGEAYRLKHVVGIDSSKLFVAKTGVRGANDLVWVGKAANYAAKLATLPENYATYITSRVYDSMHAQVKTAGDGRAMWEKVRWTFNNSDIYRSTWYWPVG
jgi:class 3 adenylate cyclase